MESLRQEVKSGLVFAPVVTYIRYKDNHMEYTTEECDEKYLERMTSGLGRPSGDLLESSSVA